MHYVKRNALAGRAFRDIHDGNRHLLRWCLEVAGGRVHGTTKQIPVEIFDQLERAALLPLPLSPWELAEWKQAKLHADCHVVFDGAYYSAPHAALAAPPPHREGESNHRVRDPVTPPHWLHMGDPEWLSMGDR